MRRKAKEDGYIMIVVMLALIMMTIGILVLVDMQTAIRGKIKIQNAADAAALTGAEWQMKSLNLIGEINIIKATTSLLDYGSTVAEADANLSEMQFRVAVTGPAIGYGAAQQAAKNNGITTNPDEQTRLMEEILALETATDRTSVDAAMPWSGWRDPYIKMLYAVYANGAAASMIPDLVVEPGWLSSEETLLAVLGFNFCEGGLHSMLNSYGDSYWSSGWQQDVKVYPRSRPGQSSVLTLELTIPPQELPENAENTLRQAAAQYGLSMNSDKVLEQTHFCTFNSKWGNEPAAHWNQSYHDDRYKTGILRKDLLEAAKCGGALSPAICQQDFDLFMNFQPTVVKSTSGDPMGVGGSSWGSRSGKEIAQKETSHKERLVTHYDSGGQVIRRSAHATAYAAAKPFANLSLTNNLRPQEIGMVLPVFSTVALVPFQMYNAGIKKRSPRYESFLIWLAQNGSKISDIQNLPSDLAVPSAFAQYILALQILCSDEKKYKYPVKDEAGNPVKDRMGNVIYGDPLNFREYGRAWLLDHACPVPSGNGSVNLM